MDENQKEVTPPSPPERQSATGHSVSAFRGLSADRWVDWINSFLSSSAHSPTITIGREELHHILIRIYDNLETQQDRGSFETALTLLFESTQTLQDNAERLYYLLQLLAYAKPPRAKRIVRRLLFDEVLTDVHFGEQHLHWMLLTTSSEYDVDDEIVDYVHRSVRRLNDFKYALLCL